MKTLWAPWRGQYLEAPPAASCFFCAALGARDSELRAHLVLARDEWSVTMLNKFPYGNGHLLVAPRGHVGRLEDLDDGAYDGLSRALRRASAALRGAYAPEGMNVGMNLGQAAGAGVADHCHWHLLPRWIGDINFMPLLGETKVVSEHLEATFDRLAPLFGA